MNQNTNFSDDWGWYIDTEKNAYINFTIEYYHNIKPNKKINYHLNRLESIQEHDDCEDSTNNEKMLDENNEIKNVEKGFFIRVGLTKMITSIFTYFKSIIFKLVS